MRQIRHPGPATAERTSAVRGAPVPLRFTLEPGLPVDQAVSRQMEAMGCVGAFIEFRGGRCEPFRYVMPAASPDADHAAWYSETFEPDGPVEIVRAGAIYGVRDDKPFIHCHGMWTTAEGLRMGHLLPTVTFVAEPITVTGIGFRDAMFKGIPDEETNFTLFDPVSMSPSATGEAERRALLLRVRPNVDICQAIESVCAQHGFERAAVHGIGSLYEVRFSDQSRVNSLATEVLVRSGEVSPSADGPRARLEIDVVGMDGAISSGELVRGDNPVCVTFELVVEELEP